MAKVFFLLLLPFALFGSILQIELKGPITPASSHFLSQATKQAKSQEAKLLLITLDTPGGLASSTRDMVQTITQSPVPVAVFIHPHGARGASAGFYLLQAADIAAMSEGTNTGAATPVKMQGPVQDTNSTMNKKVTGDSKAFLISLAKMRDRNTTWAAKAVEESISIDATTALELGVIDHIANTVPTLLKQLDMGDERIVTLRPDTKTKILDLISDPNLVYIFILVAIYGIFFELINPGALFPGTIGAISGVIALYALNILPFNYAGLALMMLGVLFMIGEVFIAGFGIMGIAGVIAFVAGSLLLFDPAVIGQDISLPLIVAFALLSLGFFIWLLRFVLRSRKQKAFTGAQEMVGSQAKVLEVKKEGYTVWCHGERWNARSSESLQKGQTVRVTAIEGLTLHLQKE